MSKYRTKSCFTLDKGLNKAVDVASLLLELRATLFNAPAERVRAILFFSTIGDA